MGQISKQIGDSSSLLKALEAITNKKAFITLLGSSLLAVLVFALTMFLSARMAMSGHGTSGALLGLVGGLIGAVTMLSGLSAAGIHLSRELRSQEELSITTGFFAALATLPRLLGIFILLGLASLAVYLVLLIVFFICKIPGVGPLLYLVVLPVSALTIGVMAYATSFITPLAGPAVWSGQSVFGTVATLWGILKERLLSVVVKVLLLNLMTSLVGGLIMGGVFLGLFISGATSMLIVSDMSSNPMAAFSSLASGGGNGHMLAGGIGALLLIASASVLPLLILISGNCIIFQSVTTGLSTEDLEAKMRGQMQTLRDQAGQASKRLGEASEALADKARAAATTANQPPTQTVAPVCPACKNPITADDVFCGNCGHRLS